VSPRASTLAVALLIMGCASSSRDLVNEGDSLLSRGDAAGAQAAYAEALRDPNLSGLVLSRAQVGEARSLLAQDDVVTAESRLNLVSDQVSAKWYYLGEVALRRGDAAEAEGYYARALDRGHRGDTARRLARLIAGEATGPDPLIAARAALARGSDPELPKALGEVEIVWRALLAGQDPSQLLARLEPAALALPDLAAVQLLRAWLLELIRSEEAAAAWALRTRDEDALEQLIASASPEVAGTLAGDLATARLRRGDLLGAIRLLTAASRRGGPAGQLALARAAQLRGWLGHPRAEPDWASVPPDPESPLELVTRVADRHGHGGDVFRAAALLRRHPDLAGGELLTAADLAQLAIDALVYDEPARVYAEAALLLVPGDPALECLAAATAEPTPEARARRLQEAQPGAPLLRLAAQRLLLGAGQLDAVRALGTAAPDVVRTAAQTAIREALASGRRDQVAPFLSWAELEPSQRAALDADAGLVGPGATPPAGRLAGLPAGRHHGSLVLPSGLRLNGVTVERDDERWTLSSPAGVLEARDAEVLTALLGASPHDVRWYAGVPAAEVPAPFRAAAILEAD